MKKTYLSNPAPGENRLSGNLVMEFGCTHAATRTTTIYIIYIYTFIEKERYIEREKNKTIRNSARMREKKL